MKTRCTNCQTTFRVTPEQLKARAGKVRCGQCQTVFNALDSLVEEVVIAPAPLIEAKEPPSPFTVASDRASFPDAEPVLSPPTEPEPSLSIEDPDEPTLTERPASKPDDAVLADPSIRILLEPALPPEERIEPDEWVEAPKLSASETQELGKAAGLILPREMTEVPGYSKWSVGVMAASPFHEPEKAARWPYVLAALMLGAILIGQLVFRFRGELAIAAPWMRPALVSFSDAFDATIPLPRNVELVSIEASDLQNDASHGNLLILNATVRNRAPYPQAYPSLELSLTDTQDSPIARRVFSPEDYLPGKFRDSQSFAANTDIGVRVWIEAKELSAAGYRLYVFYP